jgi:hypothetical protein
MKQNYFFKFFYFLGHMHKLKEFSSYLFTSTTGASGSSVNVGSLMAIVRSIGQASVIGTFYNGDYSVRQGFIQPDVMAKIRDVEIALDLEAIIYPNPFVESLTISFDEAITSKVEVVVYDLTGREVYSKNHAASQSVNVQFTDLPVAGYIVRVTANGKQFIKNILKKVSGNQGCLPVLYQKK